MSSPAPAGKSRRVPRRAGLPGALLRTPELLRLLEAEGFVVTRRMLDYAVENGFVPPPKKFGGWRRWAPAEADAFRQYLLTRSHVQPDQVYAEGRVT